MHTKPELFMLLEKHLTRTSARLDVLARAQWRIVQAYGSSTVAVRSKAEARRKHEEYAMRSLRTWERRLDSAWLRQVVQAEGVADE